MTKQELQDYLQGDWTTPDDKYEMTIENNQVFTTVIGAGNSHTLELKSTDDEKSWGILISDLGVQGQFVSRGENAFDIIKRGIPEATGEVIINIVAFVRKVKPRYLTFNINTRTYQTDEKEKNLFTVSLKDPHGGWFVNKGILKLTPEARHPFFTWVNAGAVIDQDMTELYKLLLNAKGY